MGSRGVSGKEAASDEAWRAFSESLSVFAPLTPAEEEALSDCGIEIAVFEEGDDIFVAGRPQKSMYLCLGGWGARFKVLMDGQRQIIDFVLKGSIFGSHVDDDGRHIVSAVALTDMRLAILPEHAIRAFAREVPSILSRIAIAVSDENSRLIERVISLGRRDAKQRIAHLLVDLDHRSNGNPGDDGAVVRLPLQQQDIADFLGITSVHVSRILREMQDEALIDYDERYVELSDYGALAELAEFEPGQSQPYGIPDLVRDALLDCE